MHYNMRKLELLKKIQKVDAPPFLYTRIQAKIRSAATEQLPMSWKWAGGLAFSMLIVGNLYFSTLNSAASTSSIEVLAEGMRLQSQNQFYDE
jgi:hypothetical protein